MFYTDKSDDTREPITLFESQLVQKFESCINPQYYCQSKLITSRINALVLCEWLVELWEKVFTLFRKGSPTQTDK